MKRKTSWPLELMSEETTEVDGAQMPNHWTVVIEHDDPPTTVRLRIGMINGRWQVTGLEFSNPDDLPLNMGRLTDEVIRQLRKIVEYEVLHLQLAPIAHNGQRMTAEDQTGFAAALARRQRRRDIDDELLMRVAEVYSGEPKTPARAVEDYFVVSPATASRWIKLARERGFLKPRGEA